MKKLFILIFILSFSFICYSIEVLPSSGPYEPGQTISFRGTDPSWQSYNGTWDFGDGSPTVMAWDPYNNWISHTYSSPGTYKVYLTQPVGYVPQELEVMTISVAKTRYITLLPNPPHAGETITFTAHEFDNPNNISWDFGDGTVLLRKSRRGRITAGSVVTHIYQNQGSYIVKAEESEGETISTVLKKVTVLPPQRNIQFTPNNPMVDHPVHFHASGFVTQQIDWNFGDGKILMGESPFQTHRFQSVGSFVVSAKDSTVIHSPVTVNVPVIPDDRSIEISAPEVMQGEAVTVFTYNFIGDLLLWDWGDGTIVPGGHTMQHVYERAGIYTITVRDENGEGVKIFQITVKIIGVTDEVNLEIAEIRLDNGKYYKVVSKNSKDINAVLKMKMRGTGIVTGYWMIDGVPFEFINDVAVQGEIKEIHTREIPGIPTIEPGLHTISLQLTRPSTNLTFATLKYFVLPYENKVETISPPDGFVAKEKEIPEFKWIEPKGGTKYQIAFTNYLYKFIYNKEKIKWIDVGLGLKFKPGKELWKGIKRNRWSYWKVRALDNNKNVIAESDINELKVVIATAEISINGVSDLKGNKIEIGKSGIKTQADTLLINGSVEYKGNSKYLVLRVYLDDEMVDQLLFRDVEKGDVRKFETSVSNKGKGKVVFRVLKTSSPSVVIGIKGLNIKK
ncbi:MAG: PKD domain-containing protein [Acidobacteriota bacterium]